ncbi:DegV family protein [Clostridiaceae bacterium M8S5]|nr:DegV family protein [Clostridiaceae bacterium M8S5]
MAKIKIITDSSAYIKEDIVRARGIDVMKLNYEMDGVHYKEGFPGSFNDFFDKLRNSDSFPKTSQPSAGDFMEMFKKALDEDQEVVAILLSSGVSGTYNSAVLAVQMLQTDKITVIDSLCTAAHLKNMVLLACNLSESGRSRAEIEEEVLMYRDRIGINFTVGTLEYLQKGGRLSITKAKIGNILNLKPVLKMNEGRLELDKTVRGKKRALNYMIDTIPHDVKKVSIMHVMNEGEVTKYAELVKEKFPNVEIEIEELGPIVGAHIGPNSFGFGYKY